MPDSKHTLEIVTKTKDLATKDLKRMGAEGQKAGNKIARGMGKADKAAQGTKKSFLEAGETGSKAAGLAGAGFAGAAAGISLATASAESFEGAAAKMERRLGDTRQPIQADSVRRHPTEALRPNRGSFRKTEPLRT